MKTVTQNFVDAQQSPSPAMVRQVWYKRRYWIETSKSYVWETNWTQLTEDKVVNLSNITWQLDTQTLNEFKTSNVTLTLENLSNQWVGENPYGKFAKDTVSPVYGYYPYWTKFQIRAGLNYIAAGATTQTTEVVNVFTGVATEYTLDSATGAMQITLTGEEALLIGSNAESVSTTVTNETATGSVDGANKIFTTAHNGVGIISDVSDNGISKRAGADYTLSQLNDPSNPASITFVAAPAVGHTVRVTYLYWNTNQKFETLITSLLNQAAIPGGNQQVSPVVFPSNIINTHVWQTQADWEGGSSLTDIDTTLQPNAIKLDFKSVDARQLTTYGNSTSGWTAVLGHTINNAVIASSSYLSPNVTPGEFVQIYRALTKSVGRWDSGIKFAGTDTTSDYVFLATDLSTSVTIALGATSDTLQFYHAYLVRFSDESGGGIIARLMRIDGAGSTPVSLANISLPVDSLDHTLTVVRYPNGLMLVLLDGTQILSATDTNYTTGNWYGAAAYWNNAFFKSGTVYTPVATFTGTWISSAFDSGSAPNAWSQLNYSQLLNHGSITYYTASSPDNVTYGSYVAVSGNVIGSTLQRYLKVKIVMSSVMTSPPDQDPTVTSVSAGSVTSSTSITLANFTGITCYDAITELAKFANYEFGFDASENFFFRQKGTGNTPVFTLTESTFNARIVSKVNGYDRVYSKIRATYAGYIKDISDDGLNYQGPLVRFGYSLLGIDGGSILVSADADVATGIAGSFFAYYKNPRRRVKVQTNIIPQLDLSDVINTSFQDLFPTRWYIGDTSVYIGDATKSLYGPDEQVLAPLNMKVIGMRIDTNNWMTEFDLEEVL